MRVSGHFRLKQGHVLFAALLTQEARAQAGALALLHGCGALEVWQGKVALAIAAVSCAQKREQSCVLADGQELAIAQRPADGSKVKRENPDLSYKLV